MIKVKDERGLVRDPFSKAILNTNITALQEHRKKRKMFRETILNKDELNSIKNEVLTLKTELNDIKYLLEQLINRNQ